MDNPADFIPISQKENEEIAGVYKASKSKGKYTEFMLHDDDEVKKMFRDLTIINMGVNNNSSQFASTSPVIPLSNDVIKELKIPSIMSCSSCSATFSSQTEQRSHFKTDWHRFNLKRRLKGEMSVSEEVYNNSSGVVNDEPAVERKSRRPKPSGLPPHLSRDKSSRGSSSSSSTDSEDDDSMSSEFEEELETRKNPKIFFKNGNDKILSVYRCILYGRQNVPIHDGELIRAICTLHEKLNWAVILVGGGHFAAAVFNGKEAVVHKTFHRYTVRGKQGTSQASRDNRQSGFMPRSGGANLRRYNEANLIEEIQSLLESWTQHLKHCRCIFYRAPGGNKVMLFGGKLPPFKKGDDRLRTIPFPTGRASFQEIERIHQIFSTVLCFDNEADAQNFTHFTPRLNSPIRKPKKHKDRGGVEDAKLHKSITKQAAPMFSANPNISESESDASCPLYEDEEIRDLTRLSLFDDSVRKLKKKKKKHKSPVVVNE